ncbi:MAG: PP2C family protein-serine/threonine phosphatase [Gammaproteobacteria bacterium]
MASPIQQWCSAAASDVGCVRAVNEDAFLMRPELGLWVVADGMGGHSAGDLASGMIVEALQQVAAPPALGDFVEDVAARLRMVNLALRAEAARRGQSVIGSTVAALLTRGMQCACVWVGDSRVYRYRGGTLTRLTRDHTPLEDLIAQGRLSPADAERYAPSNILSRAVGAEDDLAVDVVSHELAAGDRYLLCSDGLYREVSEMEVSDVLGREDPQHACEALVSRALQQGARDNVTVIVVQVL